MYYYLDITSSCNTSFTWDEPTRELLLDTIRTKLRVANLATYLLYHDPDYEPPPLPGITVIPEPSLINRAEAMPNGVLCDYLSVGSYYYTSQRLKDCFDRYRVDAFYADATVIIDDEPYPENYYLFSPRVAIDAMDRAASEYEERPDYEEAVRINRIKKLVLDESRIPPDVPLFVLAGTVKRIYLLRADLADEIKAMNMVGVIIKPVEEGEWMY